MKITVKNINIFSDDEIKSVADMVRAGKVGVIPTDTIYGLSSLAEDKKAVHNIYKIKKRSPNKPLVLLMKSFCMIRKYCYLSKKQYDYIKKELLTEKPLTVILRNRNIELNHLANESGGISVRMPVNSQFLMKLIKKIDAPIVSTSLNVSGKKPIFDLKNLDQKINIKNIDFILDAGRIKKNKPSKIVDICDINNIKVIRKG
jgi:L-threonylcarbamoyladenylate synthase